MRVFISHAPEDAGIAETLYHDLKGTPGVKPWMADMDLLPGQNRRREINRAIRESRYFIPILSSRSVNRSGYMHKEIRLALDELDEKPDGDIFVIPVRADECEPAHDRLADFGCADLFPSYEAGLGQIRRSLNAGAQTAASHDHPGSAATQPEPSYPEPETEGAIPMNPNAEKVRRLADALGECDAMIRSRTREDIVDCLPKEISRGIDASGPVGTVAREMVRRCMNYPGGIERLMECVNEHERNSIPFEAARQVKEEMFGTSGKAEAAPESETPKASVSAPPPFMEPIVEPEPAPVKEKEPPPKAEPQKTQKADAKTEPPTPDKPATDSPHAPWEKPAAYAFGVLFVSVMLIIALAVPEPKPFQQWLFRVVLSLASAGVGAVVPGLINVELKKPGIRAAGAFALFVIVYLLNPPAL